VRLYVHGRLSMREIAAQTFWSQTQVRRVLIANGVRIRPQGLTGAAKRGRQVSVDERLKRTQLYGMGYSLSEVAAMCGVTQTAVVNTLKREGVPRRSVGDGLRSAYARGVRPTGRETA